MRKLGYALLGLVALAAVALLGARQYLRSAEPDPGRDATLPGLSGPVEVWRDSLGVPHLWAESERDLYRAMG
ncbi:MAG: penicillin acylase family protein, partial [Gemmatimonadota bacterium]|nr:penicillin acylase family protein [Gemmatimonadota bacterium]